MRALAVLGLGLAWVSACASDLVSASREPRSSSDIAFSSWKAVSFALYDICEPSVRQQVPVEDVLGRNIFGNLNNARARRVNWKDPSVSQNAKVYELEGLRKVLIVDDQGACRVFAYSGDKAKIFLKLTDEIMDVADKWAPIPHAEDARYHAIVFCSEEGDRLLEMVMGVSRTDDPPVSLFASVEPIAKTEKVSKCADYWSRP